jgi:hypothetical protein
MLGKRGLHKIIVILLLVIISILAIMLIWFFIGGGLEEIGRQIQTECLTLDLQPVECTLKEYNKEFPAGCDQPNWLLTNEGMNSWYGDNFTGDSELVQVKIHRGGLSETSELSKVKVIFKLDNGKTLIKDYDSSIPSALETKVSMPPFDLRGELGKENPKIIKAAGVIKLSDGREFTCSESGIEIKCKLGEIDNPTKIGDEKLNVFWEKTYDGEVRDKWEIDGDNDVLVPIDPDSEGLTKILDLDGDFIIEMGWNVITSNSFGIIIGNSDKTKEIQFKWAGNLFSFVKGVDTGFNYDSSSNVKKDDKIDLKLSKKGDVFKWEYRKVPSSDWVEMRIETLTNYFDGVVPILQFDEGAGQEIRYVKMQDQSGENDNSLPCSKE